MNELYKPFQPTLTESGLKRFELVLEYSPSCHILKDVVHSYLQVSAVKPTPYPIIPDGSQAVFFREVDRELVVRSPRPKMSRFYSQESISEFDFIPELCDIFLI